MEEVIQGKFGILERRARTGRRESDNFDLSMDQVIYDAQAYLNEFELQDIRDQHEKKKKILLGKIIMGGGLVATGLILFSILNKK